MRRTPSHLASRRRPELPPPLPLPYHRVFHYVQQADDVGASSEILQDLNLPLDLLLFHRLIKEKRRLPADGPLPPLWGRGKEREALQWCQRNGEEPARSLGPPQPVSDPERSGLRVPRRAALPAQGTQASPGPTPPPWKNGGSVIPRHHRPNHPCELVPLNSSPLPKEWSFPHLGDSFPTTKGFEERARFSQAPGLTFDWNFGKGYPRTA